MADNFGLKIGLEGEKEFKKAIADINQSFKVLGSREAGKCHIPLFLGQSERSGISFSSSNCALASCQAFHTKVWYF